MNFSTDFQFFPLFKGKGVKENNKDNYPGITLFPTLNLWNGSPGQARKVRRT